MPKPTILEDLFPGRFLKAALFKGTKPTLTIKDVDLEMMMGNDDAKEKPKAIISFVERPMQLVCCKTNALCMKAMWGNKLSDWVGKRVTLFESQWNGEPAIRVWGSPDIAEDMSIKIELPRRKPIPMTMHSVKTQAAAKKPPMTAPDPRILTAWEVLGWERGKGEEDRASKAAEMDDARYLAYLNSLIDNDTADVFGGTLVP